MDDLEAPAETPVPFAGITVRIDDRVTGIIPDGLHGEITFTFEPGMVTARSEQDEVVLRHLLANEIPGVTEVATEAPAPAGRVGDETLTEQPIPPESPAPGA